MHAQNLAAIDLNLLVVLRALLTERHVTRAARLLGLSQSATSHALARLRELYGDPLLVRSGRALEPTPRALELLPSLVRGLSELEGGVRGPAPFEPSRARRALRIGAADYVQAVLGGPLLGLVQQEAPGIDLQITSYTNMLDQLEADALDMAVLPRGPLPARFLSEPLFEDRFTCILREQHPVLGRKRFSSDLYLQLGHVLVAPGGTPGSMVDTLLARRGLARRVVLQVSSFLLAPVVVAETDFVSTGPERLLRRMSAHLPIRVVPAPIKLPRIALRLVWHSRWDHDSAHRWMRDAMLRAARQL
jgi:DNA-binding transcriptional LysR family regulator